MPPELVGKTLNELKAMGAIELGNVDFRSSKKWSGMSKDMTYDSPDADENLRKSLKEIEEEDPDYFTDNIESERFELVNGDLKRKPESKQAKHAALMQKQRKIDDASVSIVLKALESGIPLPNDPVYQEMLS